MRIYPAIDLKDGKSVRLYKGDYEKVTIYGDPVSIAKGFEKDGAKYLHVVDLDGARDGKSINLDVVKKIVDSTNLDVELGGGIRSIDDIDYVLSLGVKRVILGSIAVKNIDVVKEAIDKYGSDKIVVGIDALDFKVKISGWLEDTMIDALDFSKKLESIGVKNIIFTDISRDGTLTGPNFSQTKKLIDNTSLNIVASGGVKDISNIDEALKINAYGIIIGKAIYENTIDLKEAIEASR